MLTLEYLRPTRSGRQQMPHLRRFLLALALTMTTLLGVVIYQTPQAHASSAATAGPIIHWDQGMIYPGQNNGNPQGPIGETAVVHGTGFTANQALVLVVVAGDSVANPASCQPPAAGMSVQVGTVTADATGNFSATFPWPANIGKVGHTRANSICSYSTSGTTYTLVSSADDGPFTVLTDKKPTFKLSTSSAAAGSSITVTGQNWVPPQPINVTIASCADCDPGAGAVIGSATTTSAGLTSGTFSVHVPIPANMPVNNYVVNVTSQNGPLDAYHINGLGVKQLSVTAAVATPTPTAAPSPSATAVSTQTVTATSPATNNSNTGANGSGSNSLIIIILVALAVVLLAAGGVIFFMLSQRKKLAEDASASPGGPSTAPPGAFGAGQANIPRSPVTPFPQGQPMSTPGQFSNGSNNAGYPGYNQQGQPWQGGSQSNPQSDWQNNWQRPSQNNAGFNNFPQSQPLQPQQGNFAPGTGMARPPLNRQCARCGSQLAPNSLVCGVCGMHNQPASGPNDPTVAY